MPSRDWQFRIRDIEQAITAIQRHIDRSRLPKLKQEISAQLGLTKFR